MLKHRAEEIMTRSVRCLREDTPIREAAAMLVEHRISGAPVVDAAGKLTGVLSEEDLIGVYYEGRRDFATTPVGKCSVLGSSLVTRRVVTVKPETPADEIAKKLMQLKIKRVPVVDGENRVIGIVSRKDILKALAGMPPAKAPAPA